MTLLEKDIKDKAILFLAQQLSSINSKSEGYIGPPHWLCLRKDYQEKYIKEAHCIVNEWWETEQTAKINREKITGVVED